MSAGNQALGVGALGVLSVHLDGAPCAVGCPFCYLGAREPAAPGRIVGRRLPTVPSGPSFRAGWQGTTSGLVEAIAKLPYEELAIAVSEPVPHEDVQRLVAAARVRALPVALTTTCEVVDAHPALFAGVSRLNLSVDPWKLGDDPARIRAEVARVCAMVKTVHPTLEIIALATLSTPGFARLLVDEGLLEALVDEPLLDGVALSALKPPPPFCDRAFWLSTLAQLAPLLARALDQRLYLDCYVAARLLAIGGCPARPDLSPASPLPGETTARLAFRSCVYSPTADVVVQSVSELEARVARFVPPAVCPFETRLR